MGNWMELLRQMAAAVFDNAYLARLIALCTPLVFAAIGIVIARRSGIFFLAAEGVMLFSGTAAYFSDALVYRAVLGDAVEGTAGYEQLLSRAETAGWIVGLFVGLVAGVAFTLLFLPFILKFKVDPLLGGIVFNIFALALAGVCLRLFNRQDGQVSSALAGALPVLSIPQLEEVPVLGGLFGSTGWLSYLALLVPPAAFYLLNRTDFGLRLRAAEENPAALVGTGRRLEKTRLIGMLFAGAAVSLAGVALVLMPQAATFTVRPGGEGYLALAAVWASGGGIFKSCVSVLLLSAVDALSDVWQGFAIPGNLLDALVYIAALAGLWLHAHNLKRRGKVRLRMQRQIVQGEEPDTEKEKKHRFFAKKKKKS